MLRGFGRLRRFSWSRTHALSRHFSTDYYDGDEFVNDYQGLFVLHDVEHPDENFRLLWSRIEKFEKVMSLVDVLKEWKYGGMPLSKDLVDAIVLKLTSRMWYQQARKVVNWLDSTGEFELTDRDELLRLDISRRARRLHEVVCRFSRLRKKSEQAYCILLEMAVTEKRILMAQKTMDELRFSKLIESPRPYNIMLKFYLRCGRNREALAMYKELEASAIAPDLSTYCLLMRYREAFPSEAIEEKAEAALESLKVESESRRAMMRLYGYLRNPEGVEAVWIETRASSQLRTTDYLNALEAFDVAGKIERAEQIAGELQQKTCGAGYYQLIMMLRMYARHGMMDEAEVMRGKVELEGWEVDGRCWYHLVEGYLKQRELDKAVRQFRAGWMRSGCPSSANRMSVESVVKLLEACEKRDFATAECLMEMVPATRDLTLHKAFIRMCLRTKTPAFGIRRKLEDADCIPDEECLQLLEELDGIVLVH